MRLRSSLVTLHSLLVLAATSQLRAEVYWDIDITNKAGSGGSAPSGTWSTTKADWNTNADGTGLPTTWTPGGTAIFAAGTDATGSYNVTVSGTQSLAGLTVEEGTVVQNGGTLNFGSAASSIYTSAGATWVQNTASVFAGTGGLYKSGPGTLVLRGANTFSNSGSVSVPFLTINGGVVDFNAGVSLGAAPVSPNYANITINGGTLRYTGTSLTLNQNRGILIRDSGGTIETTTGLLALSASASSTAALSGAGTITKTGTGRFELQTSQTTFTGKYVVKSGSIGIRTDATLGAVPSTAQADYFTLDGGGIYGDNSSGITLDPKRGITLGANGGFLAFNGTGLNPYDGIISGTAGGGLRITVDDALTVNSAGVVTLNGANTYNGPTEIDTNATLVVATIADGGTNSSLGKSSNAAGNLIFNGGTLSYTGGAVSTDRGFTLAAAGGFIDASGASNTAIKFTSTSTMGVSGVGPRIFVLRGTSTGDNTMSVAIVDQGTNPTTLSKTDTGTWVLTNSANSYTGNTSISAGGRLKLGASGVIPDASLVQVFSSSVFDLNGFDETVRSVSGTSGTIALGAKSLTLNNPNGEIFSAAITGSGGGKIIKNGTGKLTLSPTAATYDGGVTLNSGALGIGTGAALGTGAVLINSNVSLDNVATTPLTVTNAVWLNGNVSLDDSFISNPGAITWGTSGANKWTINGGNRTISVATAAGGYALTINQIVGQDVGFDRALVKAGNGTLSLTAANTYTGYTEVLGGILSISKPYLADWAGILVWPGATLNLNFAPGTTDTVDALFIDGAWATGTGTWGALGSGAQHETAMISGSGMLLVKPFVLPLAGDFNDDGRVDGQDFVLWRTNPTAHGGASGYDSWRQNFGKSSDAGAGGMLAQSGVPEPSSLLMAAIALFIVKNFHSRERMAPRIAGYQREQYLAFVSFSSGTRSATTF